MTRVKILALLMGIVLLFSVPAIVSAQQPQLPHVFTGTAMLDGAAAADGTEVTAWVDGAQVGDAVLVAGGRYTIIVDPGTSNWKGETVAFQIGGNSAAETFVFSHGGGDPLNLTGVAGSGAMEPGDGTEMTGPSATGEPGARGPRGFRGLQGDAGDQGDQGLQGVTGGLGRRGEEGTAGQRGAAGAAGSSGSDGGTGVAGPPGAAGAAGEDGSSTLGIVALILAIIAIVGAGGAFLLSRRG